LKLEGEGPNPSGSAIFMIPKDKLFEAQTKIKEALILNQEMLEKVKPLEPIFASTGNSLEFPPADDKSRFVPTIRTDLFDIRDCLIRSSKCIEAVIVLVDKINA
jgi:hypothetical protein